MQIRGIKGMKLPGIIEKKSRNNEGSSVNKKYLTMSNNNNNYL
jgi:hypothetical protein